MKKNLLFPIAAVLHTNNGCNQSWGQATLLLFSLSLSQGRLEKYLLTFGKNEMLCSKSYKHNAASFLIFKNLKIFIEFIGVTLVNKVV